MLLHAALATSAVLSFVFPPNASRAVELLSGDLVVTDLGGGGVGAQLDRIDPETKSRVTLPAPERRFNLLRTPQDVVVSPAGEVFVADRSWILEVDPESEDQFIVTLASFQDSILEEPIGIDLAPDGGLYVSDISAFGGGGGIVHVDRETGTQTPVFVSPDGTFQTLRLAVEEDGHILLLVDLPTDSAVLRVDPIDGSFEELTSGGFLAGGRPRDIEIEPDGDAVVSLGGRRAQIIRVNASNGAQTLIRQNTEGLITGAEGIGVDEHGELFVAAGMRRIVRVDPFSGEAEIVVFTLSSVPRWWGLAVVPPLRIDVPIDIRPFSPVNRIQLRGRGLVLVALKGSEKLDIADVDLATLAFGPSGAPPIGRPKTRDIDRDGLLDLVLRFRVPETGIALGDEEACIDGETLEGVAIVGCDGIRTVPPCGIGFELAFLLPPLMWLRRQRRRRIH
jgi:streptogramin lyase